MVTFLRSSIGKKLIMSLSGLFLLLFMAVHLVINLAAIISADLYRQACEFMDTNILVRCMVPVLAGGFIVHIIFSLWVEFKNWTGRPADSRYAVPCRSKASSWASKNMFVLGVVVVLFLALHFLHFWAHMQLKSFLGHEPEDAYMLLFDTFKNPIYTILYIVWFIALYFHMSHGFWSAFQTIGLNNSNWIPRLQVVAKIYAAVVTLGFILVALWFAVVADRPTAPLCCGEAAVVEVVECETQDGLEVEVEVETAE